MKHFQAAADFLNTGSGFPERGFSSRGIQNSDARKIRKMEKLGVKLKQYKTSSD